MRTPLWAITFVLCSILVEAHIRRALVDVRTTANPEAGSGGTEKGSGKSPIRPNIPKEAQKCDGVYIAYNFVSRIKEYPFVENGSAQSWAFKSQVQLVNMGTYEVKSWKAYIGFQHKELLVETDGAVLDNGADLPAYVGDNGTTISGYPQSDLKTSIETAGHFDDISVRVRLEGTQYGVEPPDIPMPKTIRLDNEGMHCPHTTKQDRLIYACCRKDEKVRSKNTGLTFSKKRSGDLTIMYDVMQAFGNYYQAQVTINNDNPLGRLDHWNITWEWMRGEFIYSMKGAYTHLKDPTQCIYGPSGEFYTDLDFSQVMSCARKPIISDLPVDKKDDEKVGKVPYCCRNGTVLPKTMNETQSKSAFQLQIYKIPPDTNRTDLYPPQNWEIVGVLNPSYKCSPPMRVESSEFPDPNGLENNLVAIASWQVTCNISRPKEKEHKCCVSLSAYYNNSVLPCNTCACGCDTLPVVGECSTKAPPLLFPWESLTIPFDNRTLKSMALAKANDYPIWYPLPCPDNCDVSINWHLDSDFKNGWTAKISIFNWGEADFENWFVGVELGREAKGFERAYSLNGTLLKEVNDTIFFQGVEGDTYLKAERDGYRKADPKVPGKKESTVSFTKKLIWNLDMSKGDGFPTRVLFNGEECALPKALPINHGGRRLLQFRDFISSIFVFVMVACFLM